MSEPEIKSLIFKLKENHDPFEVFFFKIEFNVLDQITRILDIEGYKEPLVIKVEPDVYRELGHILANDHWLIDINHYVVDNEFNVFLNGFKLIFKRDTNDAR